MSGICHLKGTAIQNFQHHPKKNNLFLINYKQTYTAILPPLPPGGGGRDALARDFLTLREI